MAPPIRARPRLPHSQSLSSGSLSSWWMPSHPSEGRQNENHNHRKLTKLITWITALSNSIKLWAMQCRATQDRRIMVESSDKTWPTGEGMTNHFSILALRTPCTVWNGKKTWICLWGSKNLWILDLEALGAGQHLVLVHMGWNPYIAIILM